LSVLRPVIIIERQKMRVVACVLLVAAVAAAVVASTDAAAVGNNEELRELLVKLKAQLGSRSPDVDEDEDIVIVRSAESAARPVSREGGAGADQASPPAVAPSGSKDPRPEIAENITKLVVSLLEDSLKLIMSLDQADAAGSKRHHEQKTATEDESDPDDSDSSEEEEEDATKPDDSELDASEDDRPPKPVARHHDGSKKSVRVSGGRSRRNAAVRAGEDEDDDADEGEDDGGSPIVKKMLKTVIVLQYSLIGFDLITMYPPGSRNLVHSKDVTKKTADVDMADIMGQLNKLQKQI
jgi:hypothetical protein